VNVKQPSRELGSLSLVGPLVWLIKTNGALNAYWRSMGAR
jgi:hypothetical protein